MRWTPFALALLSLSLTPRLNSETLAHVLSTHKLPSNLVPQSEGQRRITSFAASRDNSPFLLAYYDDDGSGTLPPTLHVLRYGIRGGRLQRIALHAKATQKGSIPKLPNAVSANCLGSALSISERAGFISIDTHINPSAGCILILCSDLTYSNELKGWVLAKIGEDILVEESMTHFASTHPAKLFLYNPRLKRSFPIYPSPHDEARRRFSAELRKRLPTKDWCARNNNSCDPEDFTTQIENVHPNELASSFSYDAQMSAEGYGGATQSPIDPETIHYLWLRKQGRWRQVSP